MPESQPRIWTPERITIAVLAFSVLLLDGIVCSRNVEI